jgi:DNA-binding HxlR family transcriptional regulator
VDDSIAAPGPTSQGGVIPTAPASKRHPYAQWSPDARALDLVGDKWTLLIIRDLATGPRRFVELQRTLPGISTEQLRCRLNRMVADDLLTRARYREVPPRVEYELTERARELAQVLGRLAEWGFRWAWSAPTDRERVDIAAVFRLAPGLVHANGGPRGTVSLEITQPVDGSEQHWIRVDDKGVTVGEGDASGAVAAISGTPKDWLGALGPERAFEALSVSGDEDLAHAVLSDLVPPADLAADRDARGGIRTHMPL